METRLLTKYRVFKLVLEHQPSGHGPTWAFRPLQGEEHHEFDTERAAHEWVADNPDILIRCREFVILPVYHLVLL
jgi:hypothetical protein